MGQITATRNLVATKVVRHAGQQILPIGTGSRYIALPKRICSPLLPTPLLPKICSLGKLRKRISVTWVYFRTTHNCELKSQLCV